jgi:para-nitrobenzyl esterase
LLIQLPRDEGFEGPLPVLLFIAGGGFMGGASNVYDGQYFMDEDVVVVVVNIRFMAFGESIIILCSDS